MIRYGQQTADADAAAAGSEAPSDDHIAPAPRISIQAFCETVDAAGAMQGAAEDRRLARAHMRIQMGGMAAALEA
jgi:pilus assembly protein CpaE